LPIALNVLAINSEEASANAAVQEIQLTQTAVPAPTSQAAAVGRPRILDQHYYFVNGCVSAPVDCGQADGNTWGEYYQELKRLYEEAAASITTGDPALPFDQWATEHVHFISARTAADGAYNLEQMLPQNQSQADFHMIGTSAGGASIFSYLGRALRGQITLDRRLRSAIAVDSPLGFQFPFRSGDVFLGIQAGAMKSDIEVGIGEWSKAAAISLFTVNTPNDIVNHEVVPEVPDDPAPVYPDESAPATPIPNNIGQALTQGSTWHIYTGSHMAESTQKFMEEHWR
jgi:hypothetical protein